MQKVKTREFVTHTEVTESHELESCILQLVAHFPFAREMLSALCSAKAEAFCKETTGAAETNAKSRVTFNVCVHANTAYRNEIEIGTRQDASYFLRRAIKIIKWSTRNYVHMYTVLTSRGTKTRPFKPK